MTAVKERVDYIINGGVLVVTGEIGSGKSTSLRWSEEHHHPSQFLFANIIASSGSISEFYCFYFEITGETEDSSAEVQLSKG